MKVMEIRDDWSLENLRLGERPKPEPGPGQVLVKMQAASLNYRDTVMVNRGYGRRSGELPLVPVSDGAGTVEAVGDGVTRVAVGDLVCPIFGQNWIDGLFREECWAGTLGGPLDGTMQEYMVLDQSGVVKAPAGWDAAAAATLPCAAVTAWNAVVEQGGLRPGDTVVIQGTGGVSLFALIFARMLGCSTVITSSSDDKLARAKTYGWDVAVNYRETPDWFKAVRAATDGAGADLVVEVGGAGTLEQSLRCVKPGKTIALIGVLSGGKGDLNLGPVVTQNVRLQGVTVGSRTMFEALVAAIEAHGIEAPVDPDHGFAFDELPRAIADFPQGRHYGKVVCRF